ncbi:MAG: M20/M25/M40 family metallo-hydrolase, partial [Candidatus Acidiferrum sp.]
MATVKNKKKQRAAINPLQEIAQIVELRAVHEAFAWFHKHAEELCAWQMELAAVPAPPFGEAARSSWLRRRFDSLALQDVHCDELGNVFGTCQGVPGNGRAVAVTAHIDTVFPEGTPLHIRREAGKGKLLGPGISDNSSGVTAMLAVAAAMQAAKLQTTCEIIFIGNVGEEGEGDLRGMRHIFSAPRWSKRIAYTLVVDGAGTNTIVTQALGSRRFEVIMQGPGGHSWNDFG